MIRILLADDHNLFREGLVTMLKQESNIKIIGEAEDGRDLERKYYQLKPDLVISDISMPIKNGPEAIQVITGKYDNVKVLFLSQYTGDDYIYSIIKSGALGLISKNCMKDELIYAIKEVSEGRKYFGNKTEKELENIIKRFDKIYLKDINVRDNTLTAKENEVLQLIGEGFTSDQIAAKLKLSRRTVDAHRHKIINILGLKSVSELVRFAVLQTMNKKDS